MEEVVEAALGFCSGLLFSDGFENGDTAAWSGTAGGR
jgi:hypothetical protein